MAKIPLKEARLHNSFIINGKNFKDIVDTKTTQELELVYDQEQKELWVTYKGLAKIIPTSNISDMQPLEQKVEVKEAVNEHQTPPPRGKIKAQVGGPTAHVFDAPKPL